MFNAGRKFNKQDTLFSVVLYRKLRRIVSTLWHDTAIRARERGDNLVYFPRQLLKQQTKEYADAFKGSYAGCNLDESLLHCIQDIEAEVMTLNATFKWLEIDEKDRNFREIKAIFIALDVIFSEFKDNKNTDCDSRISLFMKHITKLLTELSSLVSYSQPRKFRRA